MPDQQARQDPEDRAANEVCIEVRGNPSLKGEASVALGVIARSPAGDAATSSAASRDVLEDKPSSHYRSSIDHLGDLAAVWLYRDDNQIKEITYREEPGECGYTVAVRAL